MENPMWERILVDWVNCLKLSKPIHKVTDLRDGTFFSNLHKVLKKTSEIEFDVLTCLFHILNRHYPFFEINDKSNIHLSDLPSTDIAAITSLLMHYTCIHDRRDVLTSPLCHHLQPATQMGIKTFLEKIQECPKLTTKDLEKIILLCLEDKNDKNTTQSQNWLSVAQSSSSLKQSPLLEILKTPVSRTVKLQEKDREIARLLTDLELNQEEKENLEEDIRLQIEKNKKLEKQLKQKNIEISRLKSEVITLENRTPPHYQDKDFREAQKILRTKIEALEQIIDQCDKENEELRNERDSERVQVKSLDSQCKTWLEKFIETDNKLQSFAQRSEEYEMKYKNLEAHCYELEALLDELRPKNNNESFIEESFQSVNMNRRSRNLESLLSCEDLAHSVVDVQLKDMQKENESLRTTLEDMNNSSKQMEEIIEKITADRNNLVEVKNKFHDDLKITTEKLQQLSIVNEKLSNELQDRLKKYKCLLLEKTQLSEENENLKKSLADSEYSSRLLKEVVEKLTVERNNMCEEVTRMTDEFQQLFMSNEKLQMEYQEGLKKYEYLIHEKTLISEEYENCVTQLRGMKEDNENLKASLCGMEKSLIQSEDLIKNLTVERSNLLEETNKLDGELNVITEKLQQLSSNNVILQTKYNDEKKKSESLFQKTTLMSEEVNRYLAQLDDMQKQIENLNNSLKDKDESLKLLKDSNDKLTNERTHILEDNFRLGEELNKLMIKYEASLKDIESTIEEKMKISKEYNSCVARLTDVQKVNKKLSASLEELDNHSKQSAEIIKNLTAERNSMINDKNKVDQELKMSRESLNQLSERNSKLMTDHLDTIKKYESLVEDKTKLSDEFNKCIFNLEDMQKTNANLMAFLHGFNISFEQLKECNEKLVNEMYNTQEKNGKLVDELKVTSEQLQKLSIDNDELLTECQAGVKKFELLVQEKLQLSDEYDKCVANLHSMQKENENLKTSLQDIDDNFRQLKESSEKLADERNSIIEDKNVVEEKLRTTCAKLDQLSIDNGKLMTDYQDDVEKYESLSREKIQLSDEYDIVVASLKDIQKENEILNARLYDMKDSFKQLKESYEQLDDERNSLLDNKSELDREFRVKIDELQELSKDHDKLLTKYQAGVKECKILVQEKIQLSDDYNKCVANLKNVQNENENFKTCLQDMDNNLGQLKKCNETLANERNGIIDDKNALEEKLRITCEKLEQLSIDSAKLMTEYQHGVMKYQSLSQEKIQLSDEYDIVVTSLKDIQNENENLKAHQQEMGNTIKQLKDSHKKLTDEKNSLLNDKNELERKLETTNDQLQELSIDNDAMQKKNENFIKLLELEKAAKLEVSEELINVKEDVQIATSKMESLSQNVELVGREKKRVIEEFQNLTKTLTDISSEKSDLANQLSDVICEKKELSEELENLKENNRELSAKLDYCVQENADILDSLNVVRSEKHELMLKLEFVKQELETVIEEKTQIDNKRKIIEQDYESMKLAFEEVESEKNHSVDENQKLCEQLNFNLCQIKELGDQLSNAVSVNEKTSEELQHLMRERNEFSNNLSECSADRENLLKKLNTVTEEKLELCSLLNELKTEKQFSLRKLDATNLELAELKLIISNLTEEQENIVHEKFIIEDKLNKTVSEKENLILENSKLSADLKDISNNLKCLESEKNDLYKKLQIVVKEKDGINEYSDIRIKDFEHSNRELSNILDKTSLENRDLMMNLKSVESKVVDLESENNELHEEKSKISKELKHLGAKFEELIKDKELVNKELSILFSQLENIMIEKNKLSADLVQIKNEKLSVCEQLADASKKYREIQLENEKLKKELEDFMVKVKEKSHELLILSGKVDTLEVQNIQITEQLNRVSNIIKSGIEKLQIYEKENIFENCSKTERESGRSNNISDKINNISEDLKAMFIHIENLLGKNQVFSRNLKMYCEQNENLKAEIDEKNKSMESINCDMKNILENNQKLKIENKDLSQEVINLKLNIEKLRIENNEISANFTKVLEEKSVISNFLDLNNSELQKVIQEREDILEALEMSNKEVENISEQKNEVARKNSELTLLVNCNHSEMEALSEQKNELLQQVINLKKEIENVTIENSKLLEQLERVSQVKADFSEELDKVSQEKADITDKLQNLMKKQFENSEYTKDLLVKNEHLTEENAQLLGKLTTVSNDLDEKMKSFQLLDLSCRQLKKLADEKSDILEKVSEENKGIFDIVDRLSQEKLEMSDTLNRLSEEKMNMTETLNILTKELEILSEEKLKLSESLEMSHKELQKVKRERNEILESQTTIMKETESNILLAHRSAVEIKEDLLKRIEIIEKDKETQRNHFEIELKKVREAYVSVITTNSKLELENLNLRKKIEERNCQLSEFSQVKEAYEKLLEENSKLMTEVDTVKYKRARDREEFVKLLKREKDDADVRESKRIRDVRNEYEGKVEKMKTKMLKLYREEINKEVQKVKVGQSETDCLQETIKDLRSELFDAEQKIQMLETERDMLRIRESASQKNIYASRESLQSLREIDKRDSVRSSIHSLRSTDIKSRPNSEQMMRKVKSVSTMQPCYKERGSLINDKRTTMSTQPNVTEIEETITYSRRTSINGVPINMTPRMEMEDEDDDFNNKFLADMKAGRCITGTTGNDGAGRLSELAWRNSLVPPHLKSSYPAETQFVSPMHFKEDDLKSGNVELDDSLCKLLPGEKPRQKKDFGTTAYKKPGPPTPSKNGGRLSLQGNEVLPLREHNEKSPKKSITPRRIKALFMGRPNSRENSENQSATPKNNKRMSIFRKQK